MRNLDFHFLNKKLQYERKAIVDFFQMTSLVYLAYNGCNTVNWETLLEGDLWGPACGHREHYFAMKLYLWRKMAFKGFRKHIIYFSARLSYLDSKDLSCCIIPQPAPIN